MCLPQARLYYNLLLKNWRGSLSKAGKDYPQGNSEVKGEKEAKKCGEKRVSYLGETKG